MPVDGPVRFGEFEFDAAEGRLVRAGVPVELSPRASTTLHALVRSGGHLVTKDALIAEVWGDLSVEENNLNQQISHLRRLLGTDAEGRGFIETVPRRGYRFTVPVVCVPRTPPVDAAGAAGIEPSAGSVPVSISHPPSGAAQAARSRPPTRFWHAGLAAAFVAVAALAVWVQTGGRPVAAGNSVVTLAVLPFTNLSGDPEHDYVSEGLTEEIITELARVSPERLRVIARTTVLKYARAEKSVAEIARDVHADFIVEGSVRRDGDRVRVTAQLIRADDETHAWAESYDREFRDLLAVERELAQSVASTVRVTIGPAPSPRRPEPPPAARDAYLKARHYQSIGSFVAIEQAILRYKEAIAFDPNYALAHAGLARVYVFSVRTEPRLALKLAREAAERARATDPVLPEAQLAWAIVRLYADRDLAGAEAEFERAVALDPGNADTHFYYAQLLTAKGRFREALAAADRAQRLDPFSPLIHHYVGRIHNFAGNPAAAVKQLQGTLDLDPNYPWARMFLALSYELLGDFDRALNERQRYWASVGVPADRVAKLGEIYRADGYDAVRRAWIQWIAGFEKERGFVTSTELALLNATLGEREAALDALGRAVGDHVRDLIYLDVYTEFNGLRRDPRFLALRSAALSLNRS